MLRSHPWASLWCLSAWCSRIAVAAAANAAFPGIVEVDLIFPRNDTYEPVHLMPIVFAVQNPLLASPLQVDLEWELWSQTNENISYGGLEHLGENNITNSTSNPFLWYWWSDKLFDREDVWSFVWHLDAYNCTKFESEQQSGSVILNFFEMGNGITFTTKKGAQQPDLVAATDSDTCGDTEGFTFNITATLEADTDGRRDIDLTKCALLGETSAKPDPCAVKIDTVAVSSISASMTDSACAVAYPVVSCPASDEDWGSQGMMEFPAAGVVWLTAICAYVVTILI
ncbi:hypothetical protein G7046_g2226 [Stylonectria norvegica]|nr:hypothetical protein G7046_g2226 [Stylonectria norvegica]